MVSAERPDLIASYSGLCAAYTSTELWSLTPLIETAVEFQTQAGRQSVIHHVVALYLPVSLQTADLLLVAQIPPWQPSASRSKATAYNTVACTRWVILKSHFVAYCFGLMANGTVLRKAGNSYDSRLHGAICTKESGSRITGSAR